MKRRKYYYRRISAAFVIALAVCMTLCSCQAGGGPVINDEAIASPTDAETALSPSAAEPTEVGQATLTPTQTAGESPSPTSRVNVSPSSPAKPTATRTAEVTAKPTATRAPTLSPGRVRVKVTGPDDKIIIENAEVSLTEAKTAIDAVVKACGQKKVPIKTSGFGVFAYIIEIGGYAEYDMGPQSGWVFFYNGVYSTKGAGSVKLKDGDSVSFYYTLNLGKDVMDKE